MANKTLFQTLFGSRLPAANTVNEAGGTAYRRSPRAMLAQYAATGCFNSTFYATAEEQLTTVLELCQKIDPEFIARTALYARRTGGMKDMPALLCALLSVERPALLEKIFARVIDDGRMLRTFVQIMRSGIVGRRSLGSLPKRLIEQWLDERSDDVVFRTSVGRAPSLVDIIKMVHPRPTTESRRALYGYLIGREYEKEQLPKLVRQYEAFKSGNPLVPDVPFQMLTSLELKPRHWKMIARQAPWQMTRMNLNTFARHEVYRDQELVSLIAHRLRNAELIARARALPYQLMVAYTQLDQEVPMKIREALQDALETAVSNVPAISGKVYVCLDVSGSMHSPVTGHRPGATSVVRCVDVASLMAAAVLRNNRTAEVLPFSDNVVSVKINPRDSITTNAQRLSSLPPGGTNCSAPLALLNRRRATGDLVIFVSDNESWVDSRPLPGQSTQMMIEWEKFTRRSPNAKLVCIDLQPYGTTQAAERSDILNIGGFSDRVFEVVQQFAAGSLIDDHWVGVIERERL